MDSKSCLYRHFDAEGKLLYVGISLCAIGRLAQHRAASEWYDQIARVQVQWFASREEALAAERSAIRDERPKHNVKLALVAKNEKAQPRNERARASWDAIGRGLVRFKPLYTLKEASAALGINSRVLRRYVDSGKLRCSLLLRTRGTGSQAYVTGWDLIDFMEHLEKAGPLDFAVSVAVAQAYEGYAGR